MPKTCQTKWQENSQLSAVLKLMDSSLSLAVASRICTLSAIKRSLPDEVMALRMPNIASKQLHGSVMRRPARQVRLDRIRFLRGCREFFSSTKVRSSTKGRPSERGQRSGTSPMFVQGRRLAKMCLWGRTYLLAIEYLSEMAARFRTMSAFMTMSPLSKMFCGPSMVFTNVLNPRAAIERKSEFRPTVVRQGATLGANCTIVCGVEIGRFAFVGAGAVVTKSIPAYALVTGVPAKQVGWMSEYGEQLDLPLQGAGQTTCPHTGADYVLEDGLLTCIYST